MDTSRTVAALKRSLDIAAGLCGTLVFIAIYPIVALLIKLESEGPVIYTQIRVGRDGRRASGDRGDSRRVNDVGGRPFTISKFRTMRQDAEKNGPQLFAKGGDPRVTRVGRILRSTHLDELPQFWSVLKGDMSFIGPRPERPHFTVKYFGEIPGYRERTRGLKPGLTGLSQIVLGYDDSLESVARKTHFDLAYRASTISLSSWVRMEAWILFNTVRYLLQRGPLTEARMSSALAAFAAAADGGAGTRIALVRHRGQVRPTVVITPSAAIASAARPSRHDTPASAPERTVPAYRVASASARQDAEGPAVRNFFTVDVECWFHAHNLAVPQSEWDGRPSNVTANVKRIVDLLAARGAKATFFVLGYVAERFPEAVRLIDEAGHEIGTHGHRHRLVTAMSPYEFEKDLDQSLNALARVTTRKIAGHRASNFSIVDDTLWALEILARYGIEYDSSIFPVKRKRYGIPDYPERLPHLVDLGGGRTITEIPMSVADVAGRALPIAGGGYLRLYPHAATHRHIRAQNRRGRPVMVYFHPWEIDTAQPRVKTGLLEGFQHYVNLDTTAVKLDRLLAAHPFGSIAENLALPALRDRLEAAEPLRLRPVSRPAARTPEVPAGFAVQPA